MKKNIILISLLLVIRFAASAQMDLTLYNMKSIPQSGYSNPAAIPLSRVYVGLPVMSSVYFLSEQFWFCSFRSHYKKV